MNPIIYFTERLEIYDEELNFPIPKEKILRHKFIPISIGKVTLLITSDIEKYLRIFSNYFNFEKKIGNYRNLIVVSLDNEKNPTGIYSNKIRSIIKGFDEFENKVYKHLNSGAIVSKSGHYIKISIHDEIKELMFFIMKIIETEVINFHTKLGYLPIHSSLCINEKQKLTLVIGSSQSGKTTYCTSNQRTLISDEIVFLSMFSCLPFGHYYKKYFSKTQPSQTFIEKFDSFEREIHKITYEKKADISLSNIEEIVFLEIGNVRNQKIEIVTDSEKVHFLMKSLQDIPNYAFLDTTSFSLMILPIIRNLVNNRAFILRRRIE